MTLRGWDASHYDGPLSLATLVRARAEGIVFFTHKIAEGLSDTEGTMDDTALAAARDAGMPFIGGYLIPRTNATPAAQVAKWLELADSGEGWWRTFPGWFWQVDLERWPYDNVPASVGIDCAQRLRAGTGRQVVLYASRGQYGDSLTGWDGPLWNADYRGGPSYPGDGWTVADKGAPAGWAPYSGKVPAILQYTSSATIAGLTTCDANAFRGGEPEFRAMIGGRTPMALTDDQQEDLYRRVVNIDNRTWYGLALGKDATPAGALRYGSGAGTVPNADEPFPLWARLGALGAPATPELTGAQLDALADKMAPKVAELLGTKLDAILAKLNAAGAGLAG